jgi:PAS domain S-box-containing protein
MLEVRENLSLEHLCFATILWLPTREVVYANELVFRLLNHTTTSFQGKHLDHCIHPDDRPAFAAYQVRLLNLPPQQILTIQLRLQCQSDRWHYVEFTSRNLLNTPDVGAYVTQLTDLGERWEQDQLTRQMQSTAEVLVNLTLELETLLSVEAILSESLLQAGKLVNYDSAAFTLVEGYSLRIGAVAGYEITVNPTDRFALSDSPLDQAVVDIAGAVVQANLTDAASTRCRFTPAHAQSSLSVPVGAYSQVIGILHFFNEKPAAFSQNDAFALLPLTQVVALAVTKAYAYEQAQREVDEHHATHLQLLKRNRELDLIASTLRSASSRLDVHQILEDTCRLLVDWLGFDFAASGLLSADRNAIELIAEYNRIPSPTVIGLALAVDGNTATEYVLRTREIFVSTQTQSEYKVDYLRKLMKERGTQTLIVAPLIVKDQVIGTIGLDSLESRDVTAEERGIVSLVTGAITQALENARLYQALEAEKARLEQRVSERTADLARARTSVESILESSSDAILMVSPDGIIHRSNHALNALYAPKGGISTPGSFYDLVQEAEHFAIQMTMQRVLQNRQPERVELTGLRADGSSFSAQVSISALNHLETTATQGLVVIIRDVSDQKRAEAEVRLTRDQLRAFIDFSRSGIVLTDSDNQVIAANALGRSVFGTLENIGAAILAGEARAFKGGDGSLIAVEVIPGTEPGATEAIVELLINGVQRAFLINRFTVGRDIEAFNAVGYVISEVTEIKRLEQSLRDSLVKEKELSELKTRFVSTVSHEFRNPLAVVRSSTETLLMYRSQMTSERMDQKLQKIISQVDHLGDMMDDVLTLTRAQNSKLGFNPKVLDLALFCRDILEDIQSIPGNENRILCEAPTELPAKFDPTHMRKVIQNLTSNALKYSPRESQIEVCLSTDATSITLQVTDHGIGITEEDQSHLFEPFFRASNVGMVAGTGLGLVIARNAVELHGGKLTLHSQVGQGTTFFVTFPFSQPKGTTP